MGGTASVEERHNTVSSSSAAASMKYGSPRQPTTTPPPVAAVPHSDASPPPPRKAMRNLRSLLNKDALDHLRRLDPSRPPDAGDKRTGPQPPDSKVSMAGGQHSGSVHGPPVAAVAMDDGAAPTATARGAGTSSPLMRAIQNLFDGNQFDKFLKNLSTSDVVDYVVNHADHLRGDEKKVQHVMQRISSIPLTSENQNAFASPAFRDALAGTLAPSIKSSESVYWVAQAMDNVTTSTGNVRLFSYRPLRNALVHLAWNADTSESVEAVCVLFGRFSEGGQNGALFAMPAVRDAFCSMAAVAATPASIAHWCTAMLNMLASDGCEEILATTEVRSAILEMSDRVHGPAETLSVCGLLAALALTKDGKDLLGTKVVLVLLLRLAKLSNTPDAVDCWAHAVMYIASNDANRKLFGRSEELQEAIVRLGISIASTCSSIEWVCRLIASMCLTSSNEALYCNERIRDALCVMARHIGDEDEEAATWLCNAIVNLTSTDDHKLFFSHEVVRDAIVHISRACNQRTHAAMKSLCRALFHVTKVSDCLYLFGARHVRSMLSRISKETTDTECASWLLGALSSITNDEDNKIVCGGTGGKMHETLIVLGELVQSKDAATRWWTCVNNLCSVEVNQPQFAFENDMFKCVLIVIRASQSPESMVAMGKAMERLLSHDGQRRKRFAAEFASQQQQQQPGHSTSNTFNPAVAVAATGGGGGPGTWRAVVEAMGKPDPITPYEIPFGDLREALLAIEKYATVADAVSWWLRTICNVANAYDAKCLPSFATQRVRDAIMSISKHVGHADSVRWVCKTLNVLSGCEPFRDYLKHQPLQACLSGMKRQATTPEAIQQLSNIKAKVDRLLEEDYAATMPMDIGTASGRGGGGGGGGGGDGDGAGGSPPRRASPTTNHNRRNGSGRGDAAPDNSLVHSTTGSHISKEDMDVISSALSAGNSFRAFMPSGISTRRWSTVSGSD